MSATYAQRASHYAKAVVTGQTPACKWVRLAGQRHIDDLARRWRWFFDEAEANRVCQIIELLPHTKGRWAARTELLSLGDWQCFVISSIYGWRDKDTKLRRFQQADVFVPRKNGKSVLAAAIGIIGWGFDGEFGAEVYCGATSESQANEVFRPARQMMQRTPAALDAAGGEIWAKQLYIPENGSRFAPVIGKPGDGSSPSLSIIDEFHEHDTSDLLDTMQTGMGAREQPLTVITTTAGVNLAGPCYAEQLRAQAVLQGALQDEKTFALIYTVDDDDDWTSELALRKANPNYGVSIDTAWLKAQQEAAIHDVLKQTRFKTKHLNVWCSAKNALINLEQWMRSASPGLEIDDLVGLECVQAIDLAGKSDLCAEVLLFEKKIDGKQHLYLIPRFWLPEETIDTPGPNQAEYRKAVANRWLHATDGATIDYEKIIEDVIARKKQCNPKEFVFDPFNATMLAQRVAEQGGECIQFTQKPENFALPVDEIHAALLDGRLHHDGNPIMTWCVANTVGRLTRKGFYAPAKQRREQKIDGFIALCMAMSRATAAAEPSIDSWINNPVAR